MELIFIFARWPCWYWYNRELRLGKMWEVSNGTMFMSGTTEQDWFVKLMFEIDAEKEYSWTWRHEGSEGEKLQWAQLQNSLTECCRLLKCRKAHHLQRTLEPYSSAVSVETSYILHIRTVFWLLLHETRAQPTPHVALPVSYNAQN